MKAITWAVAGRVPAEERRSSLEDLVGAAQLLHLALEVVHPLALIGRQSRAATTVAFGLPHPLGEGLAVQIGLLGDRADRLPPPEPRIAPCLQLCASGHLPPVSEHWRAI